MVTMSGGGAGTMAVAAAAAAVALAAPGRADATWSIVAVTPGGAMGVAIASCVDVDLRASTSVQPRILPFRSRPGRPARGALVVQAAFEPRNWDRAQRLLRQGLPPAEIVARLTDPTADPRAAERQYGIVAANGRVATYTGEATPGWSGVQTAPGLAALGNTLVGPDVVGRAFAAVRASRAPQIELRLMAGLRAGLRAGGDARCGPFGASSAALVASSGTRFTALSAVRWPPRAGVIGALDRKLRASLARDARRQESVLRRRSQMLGPK
jgi:uncharacterized Ntn-hydrolase superfamily protein